jgi:hypothetical protein
LPFRAGVDRGVLFDGVPLGVLVLPAGCRELDVVWDEEEEKYGKKVRRGKRGVRMLRCILSGRRVLLV